MIAGILLIIITIFRHIHAFYLEYVYYNRRDNPSAGRASGIYSERVQTGGRYGTMAAPAQA
ncbi:hypothetical protein ANO11243_019420 [Dothideomycetidae sp. 11243]|nr:hypothetical protein ANO11243_019420 [fungal sp. No.11243]